MDVKIIASLIGITGIVVAALMSSYGYVYRNRQEYRKNSRKVLYLLLEIRYTVMRTVVDPKHATDEYLNHLTNKFTQAGIDSEDEEIDEGLRELVEGHINSIISASVTDMEGRLIPEYDAALSDLSEDNPVIAYTLRGRESFKTLIKITEEYHQRSMEYINKSIPIQWVRDVILETSKELKLDSYKHILGLLDEDAIRLAKECGRRDSKYCKKIISSSAELGMLMDFSDLDRFIEKFITKITNAANKAN